MIFIVMCSRMVKNTDFLCIIVTERSNYEGVSPKLRSLKGFF